MIPSVGAKASQPGRLAHNVARLVPGCRRCPALNQRLTRSCSSTTNKCQRHGLEAGVKWQWRTGPRCLERWGQEGPRQEGSRQEEDREEEGRPRCGEEGGERRSPRRRNREVLFMRR